MYVTKVHIKDVRSIDSLDWQCGEGSQAGWHVFIGDNGSGKSTVLRAIALAIIGPSEAQALRVNWNDWLRMGQQRGEVRVDLQQDPEYDKWAGKGKTTKDLLIAHVRLSAADEGQTKLKAVSHEKNDPSRHVWSGKPGWFAASYGPFRRFSGGDKETEKLYYSHPKVGRHLSLFGESVALSEAIDWLQQLQFKALEAETGNGQTGGQADIALLNHVRQFVNESGFLPHGARIERITSDAVEFVDGNGARLPVNELSDGYRSVLSLTFELIRQLAMTYGAEHVFSQQDPTKVQAPGVVLIDEIDAHLHPSWQMEIGLWLRRHFPHIQFFVSTHSPLICQAAATGGSVFRLAKPGTDMSNAMLEGDALHRLLYGNVLDAYDTRSFGDNVGRSELARDKMERLAELNQKELEEGLAEPEQNEQADLRIIFPTVRVTGARRDD